MENSENDNLLETNEEIDRILEISLAHNDPVESAVSDIKNDYNSFNSQQRYCWVCFATDDDEDIDVREQDWVKPCNCKGMMN